MLHVIYNFIFATAQRQLRHAKSSLSLVHACGIIAGIISASERVVF